MTEIELTGLRGDNLLAFLAMAGLSRCLEAARPGAARLSWIGPPWRGRVILVEPAEASAVTAVAVAGMRILGAAYRFDGRKNINFSREEFRAFADAKLQAEHPGDHAAAALVAALTSDGAVKRDGIGLEASALCAIFGQGHQHYLERLAKLAEPADAEDEVAQALFWPWSHDKPGLTFRWDPREDRRYAYGATDPSSSAVQTVPGANRLAVFGVPLVVAAPARGRLATAGFRRRPDAVSWPIWHGGLSPVGLSTLLLHPELVVDEPSRSELAPLGVVEVMRAPRLRSGKYISFGPAEPLWGSAGGDPG